MCHLLFRLRTCVVIRREIISSESSGDVGLEGDKNSILMPDLKGLCDIDIKKVHFGLQRDGLHFQVLVIFKHAYFGTANVQSFGVEGQAGSILSAFHLWKTSINY